MSNRDWLLIIVYLYAIGVLCQQVYSSLRFNSCFFLTHQIEVLKSTQKFVVEEINSLNRSR